MDKGKICQSVFADRETSNLLELRRSTLHSSLLPKNRNKKYLIEGEVKMTLDSDDVSVSLSNSSDDYNDLYDHSPLSPKKKHHHIKQPRPRVTNYTGPNIYGAFNNWQPQPLIKVSELARVLDKTPLPDFLDQCKVARRCRLQL